MSEMKRVEEKTKTGKRVEEHEEVKGLGGKWRKKKERT